MQIQFMPMRALQQEQRAVLENLRRDGELVITNNGQPTILMIDLVGEDLVEAVGDIRKLLADRKKQAISRPQQQKQALNSFLANIKAMDEPFTDEDLTWLENNRANFNREINL